jgi:hypothetical protein
MKCEIEQPSRRDLPERTFEFARRIVKLCQQLDQTPGDNRTLANQLLRSGTVEDYPDFAKGPCVLVLQPDRDSKPLHVVWGIPKGHKKPAVLVTAYRPDPGKWSDDYLRRKK